MRTEHRKSFIVVLVCTIQYMSTLNSTTCTYTIHYYTMYNMRTDTTGPIIGNMLKTYYLKMEMGAKFANL